MEERRNEQWRLQLHDASLRPVALPLRCLATVHEVSAVKIMSSMVVHDNWLYCGSKAAGEGSEEVTCDG